MNTRPVRAEIKGWYDTRPAQDEDYARRCVQRSLRAKVAKNYAAPQSLHVLLYLNLKAAFVDADRKLTHGGQI